MALKINAEHTRKDYFWVNPNDIIMDLNTNGRWDAHDAESVNSMVKSFEEEGGQLQAVVVRKVTDNKVQLVAGFRRTTAARKYNELHPDKPMRVKCEITDCNEEEAYRKNVIENRERKESTWMDLAEQQRTWREKYGWTDAAIAKFYDVPAPLVCRLKGLLALPREIQELVHKGELSMDAAVRMAKALTPDEQLAMVEKATTAGAKLTATEVKKAVRTKKEAAGNSDKNEALNLKEVKTYFLEQSSTVDNPQKLRDLANLMLEYMTGKLPDAKMTERLNTLLGKK